MERVFVLSLLVAVVFAGAGLAVGLWLAGRAARARQHELSDTFTALSAQALERNNRAFLDLAAATLSSATTEAAGVR